MNYEIEFLKALTLTISLEFATLFLLSKTLLKKYSLPLKFIFLAGIVPTLATLPYLWFIFPMFFKTKLLYQVMSELTAVVVETFIIYGILKLSLKNSFIISLICNAVSYGVGILLLW